MIMPASSNGQPPQERDLTLRQYDTVVKLLIADTQIYWVRSQFFLVANATLLGFEINNFPGSEARTPKLTALFLAGVIGIIICILWRRAILVGKKWMEHWKRALRQWEESAFSDVNLYRARPTDIPAPGNIPITTANLFLVVWALVTTYLLVCLCLRLCGCALP